MARALSDGVVTGLIYLQKYRFLTIAQFAKITNYSLYHSAEVLRDFKRWGMVGFIGFVFLPGHGKTPKVYYLKRKGFDLLCQEKRDFDEMFSEIHKETAWTPAMYHRLKTIDLMLSAEIAIQKRSHLQIARVLLEYRLVKKGASIVRETANYFKSEEISDNKLVPDAVFILENIETDKRALFFLETDMGTEPIVTHWHIQNRSSIRFKLSQYDRYLQSVRFSRTYRPYGEFRFFTLLFVTTTPARIETIRQQTNLTPTLANYYRFATFDAAQGDFCAAIWKSRSPTDDTLYALVRE